MSILIKGMEMPNDCIVCPFGWNGCNHQHGYVYMGERPSDCPLIPVPPHGRLIDADALMGKVEHDTPLSTVFEKTMRIYLGNAPTIIKAEEGEA